MKVVAHNGDTMVKLGVSVVRVSGSSINRKMWPASAELYKLSFNRARCRALGLQVLRAVGC